MPTKTKPIKPKRKSKGKRHPLYAESLERLAERLSGHYGFVIGNTLSGILSEEAKRVRKILR